MPFLTFSSGFGVTAGAGDTAGSDLTVVKIADDEVEIAEETQVTIHDETGGGGSGDFISFFSSVFTSSTFIGDVHSCLILIGEHFCSIFTSCFIF